MVFKKLFNLLERISASGARGNLVKSLAKKTVKQDLPPNVCADKALDCLKPSALAPPPSSKQDLLPQDPWSYVLTIDNSKSNKESFPTNKNWKLVLLQNKLVFSSYPKPPGLLSQKDRKVHLLNFLKAYMPGILSNSSELDQVEYLYFDGLLARAVVTFHDRRLAKLIYKHREHLKTSGVKISRFFKNETSPIPLLPSSTTSTAARHQKAECHTLIDLKSTEDSPNHLPELLTNDLQRPDSPRTSYEESQGNGLESFENNLVHSYCALPQETQNKILHRLNNLRSCLINLTKDQPGPHNQNISDYVPDQASRFYRHELDLWVEKPSVTPGQLVAAEMTPFSQSLEPKPPSYNPARMQSIPETNLVTTLAWDKMRELNETELGSPNKVPSMGAPGCNLSIPHSTNVSILNTSLNIIELASELSEPAERANSKNQRNLV